MGATRETLPQRNAYIRMNCPTAWQRPARTKKPDDLRVNRKDFPRFMMDKSGGAATAAAAAYKNPPKTKESVPLKPIFRKLNASANEVAARRGRYR